MSGQYARLKPYDPLRGQLKITWTAPWGQRFKCGKWVGPITDRRQADYLREVRQDPANRHSLPAFDVCDSLEEADALIAAERAGDVEQIQRPGPRPVAPVASAPIPEADDLNRPPPVHAIEEEAATIRRHAAAAPKPKSAKRVAAPKPKAKPKAKKKTASRSRTKRG